MQKRIANNYTTNSASYKTKNFEQNSQTYFPTAENSIEMDMLLLLYLGMEEWTSFKTRKTDLWTHQEAVLQNFNIKTIIQQLYAV